MARRPANIANCADFDAFALRDSATPASSPATDKAAMQIAFSEGERAKAWRQKLGLSRFALANALGFSPSQIQDYEEGARRGKKGAAAVISEAAWKRYRLACAALAANLPEAW
jgi:DNA-binding transcriptional regulator YiaG